MEKKETIIENVKSINKIENLRNIFEVGDL